MSKDKSNWNQPHTVNDLDVAFPAKVIGTLLPHMSEIPDEFKEPRNKWCDFAMSLFFNGGKLPKVKPGVDANNAKRHLSAVLSSFEPQHEHKEAGAGWLMSMWYEYPNKE